MSGFQRRPITFTACVTGQFFELSAGGVGMVNRYQKGATDSSRRTICLWRRHAHLTKDSCRIAGTPTLRDLSVSENKPLHSDYLVGFARWRYTSVGTGKVPLSM